MSDEPCDKPIKLKLSTWKELNSMKEPGKTFNDIVDALIKFYKKQKGQ